MLLLFAAMYCRKGLEVEKTSVIVGIVADLILYVKCVILILQYFTKESVQQYQVLVCF